MDDLPRMRRLVHWNSELLQPSVAPGSREEELALAELDAQRAQEERELADTPEQRSKRHQDHWRRKLR